MPEMDGFEATMTIRKLEGFSSLPIIALTANTMQGDQEKCFAAGMNAFLAKPAKLQDLKEVLEKWLPQGSSTEQNPRTVEMTNAKPLRTCPETASSGKTC